MTVTVKKVLTVHGDSHHKKSINRLGDYDEKNVLIQKRYSAFLILQSDC